MAHASEPGPSALVVQVRKKGAAGEKHVPHLAGVNLAAHPKESRLEACDSAA